jgi:tetratricopeptide (TPR) repeat protein
MRRTFLTFLVACPALSSAQAVESPDGGNREPSGPASPSPYAALDALWDARGDPAKAEEGITQCAAALAAHPDDVELVYRLTRIKLWVADGETDAERKGRLGREVWEGGDRLVKARPNWVAGHYYAAAGIGVYSQAVGILRALGEGLEGKFNQRLDKAIELDPTFAHMQPLLAKGRYYFELPWPKRNLGKSATWYRRALAQQPTNLRAMAWLAETLWRDGDVAGARAQLARVQEGRFPEDPAEEARAKSIAARIASQMDKEGAR